MMVTLVYSMTLIVGLLILLDNVQYAQSRIIVRKNVVRGMLPNEIQMIVDDHNRYRREQTAKDMEYMYYHKGLENQVKHWIDQCSFSHGFDDGSKYGLEWSSIGQNLYMSTGVYREDGKVDLAGAMESWYNEIADYDFDSRTCAARKACGHYTQMVWSSTTHIGCAYKYCSSVTTSGSPWKNAHLFGCNYGPAGNYIDQAPYIAGSIGEECTECQSGYSECDDGLCRRCSVDGGICECKAQCYNCGTVTSDCRCSCSNGWYGPSCQTPCKDQHEYCGNGWYRAQCVDMNPIWNVVREKCIEMCGRCNSTNPTPEGSCGSGCALGGSWTNIIQVLVIFHMTQYVIDKLSDAWST